MKEKFDGKLDVKIFTNDAQEAMAFPLKGSTSVFFQNEWVPINIAIDPTSMENYLIQKI
jgi:hypothetical protein